MMALSIALDGFQLPWMDFYILLTELQQMEQRTPTSSFLSVGKITPATNIHITPKNMLAILQCQE